MCPLQDEGRKQMKGIFTGALHRHAEFEQNSRRTVHRGCHTGRAAASREKECKIILRKHTLARFKSDWMALIPCGVILQRTRSCRRAPAPCQTPRPTTTVSRTQTRTHADSSPPGGVAGSWRGVSVKNRIQTRTLRVTFFALSFERMLRRFGAQFYCSQVTVC